MKKQMKIPLFISRIGMAPKKAKTLLVARRFPSLALTRLSRISLLLGTLLPALISAQAPPALATQPVFLRPAVVPEERLLWRKTIRKTPLPSKGCFTVAYPSLTWKPVACVTPPKKGPAAPRHASGPANVGDTTDFAAQAPQGIISYVEGSFDTVTTTGEINRNTAGVYSRKDQYSLQINTNYFSTPLCAHAPMKNCMGWQQFVFSNDPGSPPASLFVEYFLLGYGTPCPQGWIQDGNDCTMYSTGTTFPAQNIQSLVNLVLTASVASNGNDTILVGTDSDDISAVSSDSILTLAGNWTIAEFNVFGDLTYHTAVFDPGTSLVVRVTTDIVKNGSQVVPVPDLIGFTGEMNNLNLIKPACGLGYPFYAVSFKESNVAGAEYACKPQNFCQDAKELVASDQKAIANEQEALHTSRCEGSASLECRMFLRSLQTRLQADTAAEAKACVP
jgi:hypothetical protein